MLHLEIDIEPLVIAQNGIVFKIIFHLFLVGLYLNKLTLIDASSLSEPPILLSNGEREWTVVETAPIGTQVGQFIANTKDKEVKFEIENTEGFEGYLYVEEESGVVHLNKSLLDLDVDTIPFKGFAKTKKPSLFTVKVDFFLKISHSSLKITTTTKDFVTSIKPIIYPVFTDGSLSTKLSTDVYVKPHLTNTQQIDTYQYSNDTQLLENREEETKEFPWMYVAIPIIVLGITIPLIAVLVWAVKKYKFKKTKKPVMPPEFNDPVYHPTNLQSPFRRALPNRYIFNANRAAQENQESTRVDNITRGDNNNSKWEFPRQSLTIVGPLGEGCFGQVWQADALSLLNLGEKATVAIKTLKENATEKEKQDLLSELEVMKLLDPHPNVVQLLGCCTDEDPVFVIMEHMPYGKLQTYLRDSRVGHYYGNLHSNSKTLSSRDLTSFAYQVAKGMQYLSSKGILHRDLAARNILVGENKLCKVSDFGLARDVIDSHIYERKSEGRLPIRWMAPESLFDNIFTTKTDIWSFGILMWEIVTLGSTPYPGMSASEVMRKVKEGCRLEKPDHCKRELYNIMYYCWDADPDERPSFGELCDLLENMLRTEMDYIDLNLFPDHCYYNVLLTSSAEERL